MSRIRVLIIDDSAFMRKMISDILTSNNQFIVVGTARDGLDGLRKIESTSPDVVTLDIEMPVMNGISTLKNILKNNPMPVVMLSSVTNNGASKTFQAISLGAVDFIAKPSGSISLNITDIKQEIITKVLTASEANVTEQKGSVEQNNLDIKFPVKKQKTILAIGTSTGGPRALQQVLMDIPRDVKSPILIVQHMPEKFTKSLALRLNAISKIHVKEAKHGDIVQNGVAYIAPGNYHMKICKVGATCAIDLSQDPHENGHRPAVDVLLKSLANMNQMNKVVIVLTGMGRDGAEGIKFLKNKDNNSFVIAEAKESSIVYGMPTAAIETGHVNKIVHIDQMGKVIRDLV